MNLWRLLASLFFHVACWPLMFLRRCPRARILPLKEYAWLYIVLLDVLVARFVEDVCTCASLSSRIFMCLILICHFLVAYPSMEWNLAESCSAAAYRWTQRRPTFAITSLPTARLSSAPSRWILWQTSHVALGSSRSRRRRPSKRPLPWLLTLWRESRLIRNPRRLVLAPIR